MCYMFKKNVCKGCGKLLNFLHSKFIENIFVTDNLCLFSNNPIFFQAFLIQGKHQRRVQDCIHFFNDGECEEALERYFL